MKRQRKQEPDKSILYQKPKVERPKKNFEGKTPNILLGSTGYPTIASGALVDENYKEGSDNPKEFIKQRKSQEQILQERQSFINSMSRVEVKQLQNKFIEQTQDIAKSSKAIDAEVELERPLLKRMEFHEKSLPHGPSAALKKLELTSNVKVKNIIEKTTSDTDLKANAALLEMNKKGIDEYQLTKLLSTGTLGQKENRKLVPTKWSITATDDQLGNKLREEILDYDFADYQYLKGNYIGNYYNILIVPGEWSFELIECSQPKTIVNSDEETIITKDHEFSQGRKTYAEETAGGYYAARLAVLRYLKTIRRQARVIVFRVITPEYKVPLGVWTVRETIQDILEREGKKNKTKEYDNKEQLIEETKKELQQRGIREADEVIKESTILKEVQTSIPRWMKK